MQDINQREVNTKREGRAEDGTVVQERTRSVESHVNPKSTIINFVVYLYGFIAVLLGLRLILKLASANADAGFVSLVYSVSDILIAPFNSIFNTAQASAGTKTSVFEPSIVVAIVVYGLITWGIVKLVDINRPRNTTTV